MFPLVIGPAFTGIGAFIGGMLSHLAKDDAEEASKSYTVIGLLIGSAIGAKVAEWHARKAVSSDVTGLYLGGRR
jgi:hypothetical protein